MKHEIRTTRLHIVPENEPIFCEQAIIIEIHDEAAGEFLNISQPANYGEYAGKVTIDAENWPSIKNAIETLLKDCRP